MVLPSNKIIHKNHFFAVIGSIIAITTILATSGSATQLAFAAAGQCPNCSIYIFGSGDVECTDNAIHAATISVTASKGKGKVTGPLDVANVLEGTSATYFISGGKIRETEYSLKGTWDPSIICGLPSGTTSVSISGPIGTSVPINFQSSAISISNFTGTAQTTTPT
jgi:hypothetical protein